MILVLSCEHGGNLIPSEYKALFQGHESLLASHKGYDSGTNDLFEYLLPLATFGIKNNLSRLLIEFNRSEWSRQLFSSIVKGLSKTEQEALLTMYYRPYREALIKVINEAIEKNQTVLHLSLHSFVPELGGEKRNNDIGLLYDPRSSYEKQWSRRFKDQLQQVLGSYRVRMNYPYLGKADGLTSYFRKIFRKNYLGIELEINQKWALDNRFPNDMKRRLSDCISQSLEDF